MATDAGIDHRLALVQMNPPGWLAAAPAACLARFCYSRLAAGWGGAQRTGYTPESPDWPWTFAWTWNGPDARGGTNAHRYHEPRPHEPWEARIAIVAGLVFVPAGDLGLYALRVKNGSVAWQFTNGKCHATPVFDKAGGSLFVGTQEGMVHRLEAGTGKSLVRFTTGAALNKSLLVADDHLFAPTTDGVLHRLVAPTLTLKWKYTSGATAATRCCPPGPRSKTRCRSARRICGFSASPGAGAGHCGPQNRLR